MACRTLNLLIFNQILFYNCLDHNMTRQRIDLREVNTLSQLCEV